MSHDQAAPCLSDQTGADPMPVAGRPAQTNRNPVSCRKTVLEYKDRTSSRLAHDQFLPPISLEIGSDTGPGISIAVCPGQVTDLKEALSSHTEKSPVPLITAQIILPVDPEGILHPELSQ
jgi:hypothetical protein